MRTQADIIGEVISAFREALEQPKCRKCGCMHEVLGPLSAAPLPADFLRMVESGRAHLEAREYHCLGCEHCYPAGIMNRLHQAFPEQSAAFSLPCAWEERAEGWPPAPGEYVVLGEGAPYPVAVSTLASPELAEKLARSKPPGLCLVGKTETENIGIDKIIKNTITNPFIRFLLLAGPDAAGHCSGRTLLALGAQGVDDGMRVIGSPGRRPVLANVTLAEVEAFRRQVTVVDLIGCLDVDTIAARICDLLAGPTGCRCSDCGPEAAPLPRVEVSGAPVIKAGAGREKKLDRAGYFVIMPQAQQKTIVVEHYSYDNRLLRTIEGSDPAHICATIVDNGWVTELSHACYLGRELMRAKLCMETGAGFVQDGAC